MDILFGTVVTQMDMADAILRSILSEDVGGLTSGANTRVHLLNATLDNQNKVNKIINNLGFLVVSANKNEMTEGDADPVITCNDALIAGDSDVGYIVLLDGETYAEGTTIVTAGVATLNLVSPVDGVYEIIMYRMTGNYASGSVTITVNEVV